MAPRTGRRQQYSEESRRRILDAAIEIASERGYDGATISLVSARSGLPASSIYWHFGSKDDLLAAVMDRSYAEWNARPSAWTPPAPNTEEPDRRTQLRRLGTEIAAGIREMPEFLRLGMMLGLERRAVEAAARKRYLDIRDEKLRKLVTVLMSVLPELDEPERLRTAQHLGAFALAVADGLFLAHHVAPDDVDLTGQFAELTEMLIVACERAVREGS